MTSKTITPPGMNRNAWKIIEQIHKPTISQEEGYTMPEPTNASFSGDNITIQVPYTDYGARVNFQRQSHVSPLRVESVRADGKSLLVTYHFGEGYSLVFEAEKGLHNLFNDAFRTNGKTERGELFGEVPASVKVGLRYETIPRGLRTLPETVLDYTAEIDINVNGRFFCWPLKIGQFRERDVKRVGAGSLSDKHEEGREELIEKLVFEGMISTETSRNRNGVEEKLIVSERTRFNYQTIEKIEEILFRLKPVECERIYQRANRLNLEIGGDVPVDVLTEVDAKTHDAVLTHGQIETPKFLLQKANENMRVIVKGNLETAMNIAELFQSPLTLKAINSDDRRGNLIPFIYSAEETKQR